MNLILQPCANKSAREHYEKTIANSNLTIAKIASYLTSQQIQTLEEYYPVGQITVWGIVPKNKNKWERIHEGDIVLFSGNGGIFASAIVGYTMHNPELAEYLWDRDVNGNCWEYIYFVSDVTNISIQYKDFNNCVGYNESYVIQGLNVLQGDKVERFTLKYPLQSERYISNDISEDGTSETFDVGNINVELTLEGLDKTDKEVLIKARKEQQTLRYALFGKRKTEKCALCGKTFPVEFLRCSHIKKRCICTEEERKDINVVVPMCAFGCDELYEKGFVGVADGKVVTIKESGIETVDNYISSIDGNTVDRYNENNKKYFDESLKYHNYKK